MNIYTSKVSSKCNSLKDCGMAVYTLCKEQDGSAVLNSFMSEALTYEMCNYVRKALKNVVVRKGEVTTLYFFTEPEFQKFCVLASEDNTNVRDDDGAQLLSFSLMSNLLFTTDKDFIQSDIPDVLASEKSVYKSNEIYIIRVVHMIAEGVHDGGRRTTTADTVVYMPKRFLK